MILPEVIPPDSGPHSLLPYSRVNRVIANLAENCCGFLMECGTMAAGESTGVRQCRDQAN